MMEGAASSQILQVCGRDIIFHIIPGQVIVNSWIDFEGIGSSTWSGFGREISGFFLLTKITSTTVLYQRRGLSFFPAIAVLVVISQFHQHSQRTDLNAGFIDKGLHLAGKAVPIGFHVGIFVFHSHHRK